MIMITMMIVMLMTVDEKWLIIHFTYIEHQAKVRHFDVSSKLDAP